MTRPNENKNQNKERKKEAANNLVALELHW